jgi:pyrimidine operon attenuation protein/uracil phosphoribosyltransferase
MQKKSIIDHELLSITIRRLCQLIVENHHDSDHTVALGLQPRGVFLAERIIKTLHDEFELAVPLGYLDTTFHRDDFRRREQPKRANATNVPFIIENKQVLLIDDVLFTGRSVRAALDAMITFGRAKKVELMVLIDRKYRRDLPIAATYVGKSVNTLVSEHVEVEWKEQGFDRDTVWIINND